MVHLFEHTKYAAGTTIVLSLGGTYYLGIRRSTIFSFAACTQARERRRLHTLDHGDVCQERSLLKTL